MLISKLLITYFRYCRAGGRGGTGLVRVGGLRHGKRVVMVSRINLRFLVQLAGLMNYYRDKFCWIVAEDVHGALCV